MKHGHAKGTGWRGAAAVLAVALGLAGCEPAPAIRIGFLGDLSDRDANFSADARNGVVLAIEQANAAGGIAGRRFELLVQDYGGDAGKAVVALRALLDARVDAVIGPYASPVAIRLLPLLDEARVLMLGPTVSADALVGKDDHLVRLNVANRHSAQEAARMLHDSGWRRVAVARDMRNHEYAGPWGAAFRAAFSELGGAVLAEVDFGTDGEVSFQETVRKLVAHQPDGLLFIAGGVDAARLAQQVAKRTPRLPVAASGWAAGPDLVEIGGKAVEGMLVAQTYSPADTSARWIDFRNAYQERFGRAPSYSAIASFDAMGVLTQAMARARHGASIRETLLQAGPYQGLQQTIGFDRFGDAERNMSRTVVRNGRFEQIR